MTNEEDKSEEPLERLTLDVASEGILIKNYDREGNQITHEEFAELVHDNPNYVVVADAEVNGVKVRTRFFGWDENELLGLPEFDKLTFGTLIGETRGDSVEFAYPTKEAASAGHAELVDQLKSGKTMGELESSHGVEV